MALFKGFKKKKTNTLDARESKKQLSGEHVRDMHAENAHDTDAASKQEQAAIKAPKTEVPASLTHILKNPRITEKAAYMTDRNVYVFDVFKTATKPEIAKAVKALYKVEPISIKTVQVPSKTVRNRRGVTGVKGGGKKAYVELKKGDTIEFV